MGAVPDSRQDRTVSRWQSNALLLHVEHKEGRPISYLGFTRAGAFTFDDSGFSVWESPSKDGDSPVLGARYLYVSPA
jgi:hypothetical protein